MMSTEDIKDWQKSLPFKKIDLDIQLIKFYGLKSALLIGYIEQYLQTDSLVTTSGEIYQFSISHFIKQISLNLDDFSNENVIEKLNDLKSCGLISLKIVGDVIYLKKKY